MLTKKNCDFGGTCLFGVIVSKLKWFQAVNGLCLAEFKQRPSGQMGDEFSPLFRSLRLAAYHGIHSLINTKTLNSLSTSIKALPSAIP